ncbi:putative bet3 family protein [Lasiodiplodia theobromae]|uniref:Trafficking protein particle complex subunit 6B n=1 Tax=Lasiodiplodia theobromae TaxID=45133 RepID=A0A5N5DGZ8_9PEZI|nr:Bet3 family protein [Lasiodiplodia theobromae]KAB2576977.1 Trafficking protein particle complex subunit 6B [Lasiodiplodia theobromae]KAF4543641.1 Bet3 family protein [Lasiodiplodia theobromae]KAF9631375.1 putative bet3 family protein [Lasiodiplodia theobromae]
MSYEAQPPPTSNEPGAGYINSSVMDFLLIELVPMAYRMAAELAAREEEYVTPGNPTVTAGRRASAVTITNGGTPKSGTTPRIPEGAAVGSAEEEDYKDAVLYRLETLGYRVGLGITERFSRDKPRFSETLDVIKFLCKDLWTLVFRKQIDNLKTNHRGIYVLTDQHFKPLTKMSLERGIGDNIVTAKAQPFLYFPAGLIRGALASMGILATVTAESTGLPGATFQIRTQGAKS